MPSASVSMATAVKPGFFSSWRKAKRRSFIAQCLHRIDLCSAERWQQTSQQGDRKKDQNHAEEHRWFCWTHLKQLVPQEAREQERGDHSYGDSYGDQTCAFFHHHA